MQRSPIRTLSAWALATGVAALLAACSPQRTMPLAFVASAGNNHLQVIDLATGETLRKVYSGAAPWRLEVSPDHRRLWVQHWYSGTTAVVDLESTEIVGLVPARGPGVFSRDGETFLTFDWPASTLKTVDAASFEVVGERATEVKEVYDLAPTPEGESLYLVQYDPMARGPVPRYGYLVTYPYGRKGLPATAGPGNTHLSSRPTGKSPVEVLPVPGEPFLLTADSGTNGLTVLNNLGDGRSLAACPAPRDLLLSPDRRRLVVLCWEGQGAPLSRVASFTTDFSARPWPRFEKRAEKEIPGALVAGTFTPGGGRVLAVDRSHGRLLEMDPASLEIHREVSTGDVPLDVVVVEVSPRVRERWATGKSRGRRLAEDTLEELRQRGEPFTDLSWTETATWFEDAPGPDAAGERGEEQEKPKPVEKHRRLRFALRPPDGVRIETDAGETRIARGGTSLTLDRDGRFWVAPRQELAPLLYALPALSLEQAVRELAGDVPGSPFLRTGIALDMGVEVEQEGTRYRLLGAPAPGVRVAQLWVDADTGLPTNLVEQFPVFRDSPHARAPVPGIAETKLYDFTRVEGRWWMPTRLERVVEGEWTQRVALEGFRGDQGLAREAFDPTRLGKREPEPGVLFRPAMVKAGRTGGGVPVLPSPQVASPLSPAAVYNTSPPTSGAHLAYPADWGVHAVPVPLALQVHNLMDGGVALQYNCPEGCPELVERLAAEARSHPQVLVAPYPWMDSRLALTAWGRIETLEAFDGARIEAFIATHGGHNHHAEEAPGSAGKPGP